MRFNSIAARTAFRAVQREFGETVRVEPRQEADYTDALPDPTRPARQLTAVVALTPTVEKFEGAREGSRINTGSRISVREATIWLTPDAYAAIGYKLVEGDRVLLTERPQEPPYKLSRAPETSDRGDVVITLVVDGNQ